MDITVALNYQTWTVRLSRPRPVSGVNHIAPTRLTDGKTSLDPLRSVQFRTMCIGWIRPVSGLLTHSHFLARR